MREMSNFENESVNDIPIPVSIISVAKASEIVQKAEESGKKAIEMVESTLKTLQNVTSTELKEYIKATMRYGKCWN